MRLIWAFEVILAPDAKLPLDPRDHSGDMPGDPGEQMPVVRRIRSEAKRTVVNEGYTRAKALHTVMEPLVHDGRS